MNKLTLLKIKMKNRAYHRFLKTKDQHDYQITKCMLNIEINRETLAEKQLQIMKNPCREM